MQFLSFAASVQAPSHPPGVVADMDIRTVLNSDILQPVVGQYTVAKLICMIVVLCWLIEALLHFCGSRHLGNPA